MDDTLIHSFALNGRTAVVTGGASGIGRETVRVLAQAGATVVIADVHEAGLSETATLVNEVGGKAIIQRTDVARRAEVEALADAAVQATGQLDIWINCAGIVILQPMLDVTEEELDRVVAVNLKGVFWGCIAAGQAMKQGGGTIINISSGGGEGPVPLCSTYSATKAGVNMITRSAALELGPFGVRVNTVAPGWVDTPMTASGFRDESGDINQERRAAVIENVAQLSPLGLTGTPLDIALAVLYLSSDASRFVTGQILRPNGGVQMP